MAFEVLGVWWLRPFGLKFLGLCFLEFSLGSRGSGFSMFGFWDFRGLLRRVLDFGLAGEDHHTTILTPNFPV